jgi:serine/threonine protein kinase/tetratricopeptide (TPR) repeat protein
LLLIGLQETGNNTLANGASGCSSDRLGSPPQSGSPVERIGTLIGRYKLLQQIGEGGCGVVYMAQQEEPVRRRVALKVIKLGMDTKQVIGRFEAERQALALMDHPNIAKVLDAGTTDAGRPYFVMELVRGTKITDYCDANSVSTAQRLALFIQVCHAVQHAHQKGIIHRDLKPSNILVTINDGIPVPKVIDFGIAKATTGPLTDKTLFTAFEQFMGTPAYMSPEQAEMTSLDIDTRSDIYSLGVLLYELLTGKTPFDTKDLLAAGLEAIRRTIREKEPARPSTRLSSMVEGELTATAKHRQTDPPKLIHLVRGDLDWIVMRCLEKDRTRRYETANGLAADIVRHLNQEPVVARPPSKLYRFGKLLRRNRLAFGAAAVIAVLLVVGVLTASWLAVRAKAQASKSKQVVQLLNNMLAGVGPDKARGRDTAMLKEILEEADRSLSQELKAQPEAEAELRTTVGGVYRQLGEYAQAESELRRALELRQALLGLQHPLVAASLTDVAVLLGERGKYRDAEVMLRRALAMRRKLLPRKDLAVTESLNQLGIVLCHEDRLPEAEGLFREALALREEVLGPDHLAVAETLNDLGLALDKEYRHSDAEAAFRDALRIQEKLLPSPHPELAGTLNNLGIALYHQARFDPAEDAFRRALDMQHQLFGNQHPDIARTLNNLGGSLRKHGKLHDAEALLRQALEMRRTFQGNQHADLAYTLNLLVDVLYEEGKAPDAEPLAREALAIRREALGDANSELDLSINGLGLILFAQKKFGEVEAFYRDELPGMRARLTAGDPRLASALGNLAAAFLAERKFAEAETAARECLTIREASVPDEALTFSTRCLLGSSLLGQGKYADAEPLLLSGYEGIKQRYGNTPKARPGLRKALQQLVQLYEATDQAEKATRWKQELTEFELAQAKQSPSASPPPPKAPP